MGIKVGNRKDDVEEDDNVFITAFYERKDRRRSRLLRTRGICRDVKIQYVHVVDGECSTNRW